LSEGVIKREELFITSKLWYEITEHHAARLFGLAPILCQVMLLQCGFHTLGCTTMLAGTRTMPEGAWSLLCEKAWQTSRLWSA